MPSDQRGFAGAPSRIRTCGLLLRRQSLYPLSYRGWTMIQPTCGDRAATAARRLSASPRTSPEPAMVADARTSAATDSELDLP